MAPKKPVKKAIAKSAPVPVEAVIPVTEPVMHNETTPVTEQTPALAAESKGEEQKDTTE